MRKTNNKWSTEKCGRCYQAHHNYTGKLDRNDVEYVVCGVMNKKMNVPNPNFKLNQNEDE